MASSWSPDAMPLDRASTLRYVSIHIVAVLALTWESMLLGIFVSCASRMLCSVHSKHESIDTETFPSKFVSHSYCNFTIIGVCCLQQSSML